TFATCSRTHRSCAEQPTIPSNMGMLRVPSDSRLSLLALFSNVLRTSLGDSQSQKPDAGKYEGTSKCESSPALFVDLARFQGKKRQNWFELPISSCRNETLASKFNAPPMFVTCMPRNRWPTVGTRMEGLKVDPRSTPADANTSGFRT